MKDISLAPETKRFTDRLETHAKLAHALRDRYESIQVARPVARNDTLKSVLRVNKQNFEAFHIIKRDVLEAEDRLRNKRYVFKCAQFQYRTWVP